MQRQQILQRSKRRTCFCLGGERAVKNYPNKPLLPHTGKPLIVFGRDFCTTEKLELVIKVEAGLEGFCIRSLDGRPWFTVERKSIQNWNTRTVLTAEGDPICSIERNPKGRAFKIFSQVHSEPQLVGNLKLRRSFKRRSKRDCKEELRGSIIPGKGGFSGPRALVKASGLLGKRLFGVSWCEDRLSEGRVVAAACGTEPLAGGKIDCYVLEIPAGVDAALIVALALAIDERGKSSTPPSELPLSPLVKSPPLGFGNKFVTESGTVIAFAVEKDHVTVLDATGKSYLYCDRHGLFTNTRGRPVFEVPNGSFRVQGITEANRIVDMSFTSSAGDGTLFRLAMLFCTSEGPRKEMELLVMIEPGEPTIPIYFGRDSIDAGKPVARVVLGNQDPNDFEAWFYAEMDRLDIDRNPEAPPFLHVGIGAEVAAGVDVAVVVAAMLLTIKYLPTAISSKAMLGVIHPSGVTRWDALHWMLDEGPVSDFLSHCGLDHFGKQVRLI
ncbi:hypothetical protein BSKO_11352 [Bryopsis sp. KO-2023]|nr:hypothetical protein BSKO_11352 [Bryopsis sp. KO-2023]